MTQPEPKPEPSTGEQYARAALTSFMIEKYGDAFFRLFYNPTSQELLSVTDVPRIERSGYVEGILYAHALDQEWAMESIMNDLRLRISTNRKGRTEGSSIMVGTAERETRRRFNPFGVFGGGK